MILKITKNEIPSLLYLYMCIYVVTPVRPPSPLKLSNQKAKVFFPPESPEKLEGTMHYPFSSFPKTCGFYFLLFFSLSHCFFFSC